ncbi:MAG: hypothetical protein WBX15_11850, partial [Thermoanaerobaculia bacterium]
MLLFSEHPLQNRMLQETWCAGLAARTPWGGARESEAALLLPDVPTASFGTAAASVTTSAAAAAAESATESAAESFIRG